MDYHDNGTYINEIFAGSFTIGYFENEESGSYGGALRYGINHLHQLAYTYVQDYTGDFARVRLCGVAIDKNISGWESACLAVVRRFISTQQVIRMSCINEYV